MAPPPDSVGNSQRTEEALCKGCGRCREVCTCVAALNALSPDGEIGERSIRVFEQGMTLAIDLGRDFTMAPPSVEVKIVITDETTHEMVKHIIPLALRWRDAVIELQGPIFNFRPHERFLDHCDRLQMGGRSYSDLADSFNQSLEESIGAWVRYVKNTVLEFDGATYGSVRELALEVDRRHLGEVRRSTGKAYERDMRLIFDWIDDCLRPLASFFKEEECSVILVDAVERVDAGKGAFLPHCPIDRQKMISVLRTWRRSPKGRWAHRLVRTPTH